MRGDLVRVIKHFSAGGLISLVAACSAFGAEVSIGGTVKGLTAGHSLILLDDGTDALTVSTDGTFKFKTALSAGAIYDVTVGTQPTNEVCKVTLGSGRAGVGDVTNVGVFCAATASIGGTLSGLTIGKSVALLDNRKDALTLSADGKFTFPTRLPAGSPYDVTIGTEPSAEKCTVAHARGTTTDVDVTNVSVSCAPTPAYTVGGTLSGLPAHESVTLLNNGGDTLLLTGDGKFVFKTPLDRGVRYDVTVGTQPAEEDCTVGGGSGLIPNANVTTVTITCKPTFTIGGTLTGLKAGDSLELLNNRTDALTLTTDGKFTFNKRLLAGATYDVVVRTQPTAENCKVTGGRGNVHNADVTNISVSCTFAPAYTIGGTVSGLKAGDTVTLLDNGGDALAIGGNGKFIFKTPLDNRVLYDVTVAVQAAGEDCNVAGGIGVVNSADVTNISVNCGTAGTHTIGGTVSGLKTGESVTLLDNGADALIMHGDGKFTFVTPVASGSTYDVTVRTQPASQVCAVADGSGTVRMTPVTNVTVLCVAAPNFTIGGTLSGLSGGALLTLLNNGGNQLNLVTNGPFTFGLGLQSGATYNVTVGAQPSGETCTVVNGSGTVGSSNITNVTVSCKSNPTFTIGGTLSGLNSGASVTLADNGTDTLVLSANGIFTFATALPSGTSYNVTVTAQPAGETCVVSGGTGTVGAANVTSVAVSCKANPTFTIGGTVSGLSSGASVMLLDNGSDSLTVNANGAFTFKIALATGAAYNVTISAQPNGETCKVANGSGTVSSANITNIAVTCLLNTFTIGGTVSGLTSGASLGLQDNGTDSLTVNANGAFTFKTALATGATYNVTVSVQPSAETCTISNGTGTVASANVTNATVSCAVNTFTIGGTAAGLTTGTSVTLLSNGGDSLVVSANGAFTFKTALPAGATYSVTVGTQPSAETCKVTNGSGTVSSANITNIAVNCAVNTFTVGGTVSGLSTGASVVLQDNGTDSLAISSNGSFTFATALNTGVSYNVAVSTQPAGETCTVTNGSGTIASANITNVLVSCAVNTFVVGGTVSGLSNGASVALLDNGGDSLTVNANGPFAFKTALASGASYNVTVSTQPTGETCTVSNGSGAVGAANVTNVAVTCSSNTGGSGTFWTPYTATPTGPGGSTGLFLMPSDNLESSPAPQFITTTTPQFLDLGYQFTPGSNPTASTPALMIYAAAGSDGSTHVYGLKLSDTSGVPAPAQLSSLSVAPGQQICGFFPAQTDLSDPTTAFVILNVATTPCGSGGDVFEVLHYQDLPTTAPTMVNINTTLIFPLYQDGKLDGLALYDANAQSLNLYSDATFTSATHLLTGVTSSMGLRGAVLSDGTPFGGTVWYFNLTAPAGQGLYRIDSSALALTQVHQGVLGLVAIPDKNNLYFTDVTSSTTTVFYQVPLAGGTPMVLYNGPYQSGLSSYLLQGTDDSVLAFQFITAVGSPIGTTTNFFYAIPIGVTSNSATTLGGPYIGNVLGFVASPVQNDAAGSVLFVTIINKLSATPKSGYSSVALPLSGSSSTNTTPLADSAYPTVGSNTVFLISGITDTGGGPQGGGMFNKIDISTLQGTPLTTTGGADYVIPTGYVPGLVVLGNTVIGNLIPFPPAGGANIGLAVDLSKNFVLPIALPNTSVSIF